MKCSERYIAGWRKCRREVVNLITENFGRFFSEEELRIRLEVREQVIAMKEPSIHEEVKP